MAKVPMAGMAKAVVKSLLQGSACRMYPAREPVFHEATRGRLAYDPACCILCTLCAKKCPAAALAVDREKRTWRIDRLRCISCGECVESCPKTCLSLERKYTPPATGEVVELYRVEPPAPEKE